MNQSEAAEIVGVNQQRISYWVRTGLLSVEGGGEHGRRCSLTGADLMRVLTIKELREQGASLQVIRPAIKALEDRHGIEDWHGQWLYVEPGSGDVVWFDQARDALLRLRDSQGYIVDVTGLKERLADLPAEARQGEPVGPERETVKA